MNKRFILGAIIAMLSMGISTGPLTSTILAADLKIAVVNVRAVATQIPQRDSIAAALQQEFKERGDELRAIEDDIKKMQAKGQADQLTMSEQQKTELIRNIQEKAGGFKLKQQAFQEDFKGRSDAEQRNMLILIKKAIDQVALADSYDIVLQAESVAYISDRVDITQKVIALMADPKFN